MIAALARLAARRCLPTSTRWILVAAGAALVWSARSAAPSLEPSARDALERHERWFALGAFAAALMLHRAACLALDWRRRDADAFGGAPRSRSQIALASWLGAWTAACVVSVFVAVLAEARTAGASLERELGRVPIIADAAAADQVRLRALLEAPTNARWIELELGFIATDVTADVTLSARRGAAERSAQQRVSSRTRMRVEVPPGAGPVELTLVRSAGRAVVFLTGGEALWLGAAVSPRWASASAVSHWWLAFAAWTAVAFALGAYLPPTLAALTALALAVPAWFGEHPAWSTWSPWGALPSAFEALGRGVTPAPPALTHAAGAAVCIALALWLAARGLRTWRAPR